MRRLLEDEMASLDQSGVRRQLKLLNGIDFCSNDYLGLSQCNFLKKELLKFIKEDQNLWCTSSRLIQGNTCIHEETEEFLASYLERESSLLFNSGYNANLGVIETLCCDAIIFSDELNHASIIDGIKNTRSQKFIYKHRDLNDLESQLKGCVSSKQPRFVISESIFSMEGTLVSLSDLISVCDKYGAFLILDEAHSTGVFGTKGQGLLSTVDFDEARTVSIHTCGKAIGSYGAFIGCNKLIREYLINKCRHFIYTTATPPLQVFQTRKSIEYILKNTSIIDTLWQNIEYMNHRLPDQLKSDSPIFSVRYDGNSTVCDIEEKLISCGLVVKAIRWPTVPKRKERIRVSIHSNQSKKNIDALVSNLIVPPEKEKNKAC